MTPEEIEDLLCGTPLLAREALRQMAGKLSAMQAAFNQACDHRDEAQARVSELERQVQESHAELEEIARLAAASVMNQADDDQQPELADLRARLKVLERIAYDLAMLVSDHVTEDVAGRDAAMGDYVEYLSKPNKR